MRITIRIDAAVCDRLQGLMPEGMSYSAALAWPMDSVKAGAFFASFRRAIQAPDSRWISEGSMKWD